MGGGVAAPPGGAGAAPGSAPPGWAPPGLGSAGAGAGAGAGAAGGSCANAVDAKPTEPIVVRPVTSPCARCFAFLSMLMGFPQVRHRAGPQDVPLGCGV